MVNKRIGETNFTIIKDDRERKKLWREKFFELLPRGLAQAKKTVPILKKWLKQKDWNHVERITLEEWLREEQISFNFWKQIEKKKLEYNKKKRMPPLQKK
ncbi:MAG: hypothetical protein QM526_00010 [Alphaproteobacteria bacterium]|nr:hypothetical protein [Alphaproteobacteria bacterium]